eukprot:superscaffoldBa00001409_g10411
MSVLGGLLGAGASFCRSAGTLLHTVRTISTGTCCQIRMHAIPQLKKVDRWTEKRSMYGVYDNIGILGDFKAHPKDLIVAPCWLKAFKVLYFRPSLSCLSARLPSSAARLPQMLLLQVEPPVLQEPPVQMELQPVDLPPHPIPPATAGYSRHRPKLRRDKLASKNAVLLLFLVVDIMRVNVDKVLERDQKLSELDDRADALQAGASQFESCAAKLKNKYWWKNCKVGILIWVH